MEPDYGSPRRGRQLSRSLRFLHVRLRAGERIAARAPARDWQPDLLNAYEAILRQFVGQDDSGLPVLKGACKTAGLGLDPRRDGFFAYYVSEPAADNDFKGVGAFILASVEIERLG